MNRIIFTILLVVLIPCRPGSAMDLGVDQNKTSKEDKDKSKTEKKSMDKKESKGDKQSETNSKGKDLTDSKSLKEAEQSQQQKAIDVSQSLEAIFAPLLADAEQAGLEPFASCHVAMRPRLPADFGLTAQIGPNTIDSIKADWLSKAATSNARLEPETEKQIHEYGNCLAYYGLVVAQAYLNLGDNLHTVGSKIIQGKGSEAGINRIDLSLPDFAVLAEAAFYKATKVIAAGGIRADHIKTYNRVVRDNPCYFAGVLEKINCGGSIIAISAPPQLQYAGLHIYGQGYFGYQGTYKISSSYSYSNALEDIKSVAKYKKWAEDVSVYAESLRSKGMAVEAVYVEKKAVELANSGKVGISPAKLMPGLHE